MNDNKKIIHPPYNKLKGKLKEKELTYGDVAVILDISEVAVSHKINGTSDFYISEVRKMSDALGISNNIFLQVKFRIRNKREKINMGGEKSGRI